MICIGTLTQNKALETFLKDLNPNLPRGAVTSCLGEKALGFMTDALYTEDLSNVADALGCSKKTGKAFVIDGGLGFRDVRFLVDVIWKSRKAIIPLRRGGLLPDYNIPNDYVPVDQEDFCAIAGAWIDMLTPPLDLALAPVMLLDVSIILFRWVFCLMANMHKDEGKLVGEGLAPAIMRAGFERLRLEIDREWNGPMPAPRCGFTRNYAAELFGHTSIRPRPATDFTEDEPDKLMHYIDSLDRISQALAILPPHPDDLSESIFADWFRVNTQIAYHRFGILPSNVPRVTYEASMDVWGPLLPKKLVKRGRLMLEIYECDYPRCADPMVYARHPEAN
ncbi:hypothetical protein FRC11_008410, partial [Ceratobasidium sp. 423]